MSNLALPIIGLTSLFGYFFNKNGKTNRKQEQIRQKVSETEIPNGNNIYSSNKFNEVTKEELNRSIQNYKLAESPQYTGMLPPLFNTYNQVGNESSQQQNMNSQQLGKLEDIYRLENVNKTPERPL